MHCGGLGGDTDLGSGRSRQTNIMPAARASPGQSADGRFLVLRESIQDARASRTNIALDHCLPVVIALVAHARSPRTRTARYTTPLPDASHAHTQPPPAHAPQK